MNIFKLSKQLIVLSIFIATVFSVSQIFTTLTYAASINTLELDTQTNIERTSVDLHGLRLDSQLSSAALAKANDMIAENYWSHNSPSGTTPWSFISGSGYKYTVAGENLAMGFSNSKDVVDGWMASPAHKANVLDKSYTDVGYAVVEGELIGSHTTLVVAMYGNRSISTVAGTATASSPTGSINSNHSFINSELLFVIVGYGILLLFVIVLQIQHIMHGKSVYRLAHHAVK